MSAGQFTVPVTVLQRAQMTRIGAHHGRHRLTGQLRQIGGSVRAGRRPALITARRLLLSAACERIADSVAPVIVLVRPSSNSQNIQFGALLSRRTTGQGLRDRSGPRARLDWARA